MSLFTVSARVLSESELPFDPNTVTPGVVGFLATIVVVGVVVLLVRDMVGRIRRTQYRAEVNERLDAEQAASAQKAESAESAEQAD